MREILLLEMLAAVFILLSLLQPLVKGLWALRGLAWLPLLSLGIIIGLFPAYGFRPECVPLLVFTFFLNIFNIPALSYSLKPRPDGDFYEPGLLFILPALVLLVPAVFAALYFAPPPEGGLLISGIQSFQIRDEAQSRDYSLRIYEETGAAAKNGAAGGNSGDPRPLLFLIPPETGSIWAVDRICADLKDRGFTVISYSRRDFDSPVSPLRLYGRWQAFQKGTVSPKANETGRALEQGRREDLEFLLPRILRDHKPADLFLAGYGAGGAALLSAAENPGFTGPYPLRGLIIVESRLWSLYRAEDPAPALEGAGRLMRFWEGLKNRLPGSGTRKMSPAGEAPRPAVPVLYLVSSRILDRRPGKNPYEAVYKTLRASVRPAILAALEGAGPLDYTDYSWKCPVYSFLFPGIGKKDLSGPAIADSTVSLMTNFAALLLEDGGNLKKVRPAGTFSVESRSWTLPDFRYILN
jgi:hypothetical protein